MITTHTPGSGPRIHALFIGIGGYPHLIGGTGVSLTDPLKFGRLGQLTTPPRSALALAKQFEDMQDQWIVPLGTTEVLISPSPHDPDPAGDGRVYSGAKRAQIQKSFEEWWARCAAHEDNVAMLYIAGHGIEGGHQLLLASDFGEQELQPWLNTIDIDETLRAMPANRAKTQIVMVDACREVTSGNTAVPFAHGQPLRCLEFHDPSYCRSQLNVRATQRNRRAYGPELAPSYFAAALIEGLKGGAAEHRDGAWWITTGRISSKFEKLFSHVGGPADQVPRPSSFGSVRLAKLPYTPKATLHISCHPSEANPQALLSWRAERHLPPQLRPVQVDEPWTVELDPGVCYMSATFESGQFVDKVDQMAIVEPPVSCEKIVVS